MEYYCHACRRLRSVVDDGFPPNIRRTQAGELFVHACPECKEKEAPDMSMSRRHYEEIADAIAETVLDPYERAALAARLSTVFKTDNPLFRSDRFAMRADAMPKEES